jgi:hypothetical protein
MSSNDKMRIGDNVTAVLGNVTVKPSKTRTRANVHTVLTGPDGKVKVDYWGENLVTDRGDEHITGRIIEGDTEPIITGMKLGTDGTAEDKNAQAGTIAYISGSNEALDAAPTDATKGPDAGWRATFVCTWIAGDVTNGNINEVALTNQTALTDTTAAEADTMARYVFGAAIDKQAGDSLEVTWQIDVLGA